jgi:hypothetical protein
MPFYGNGRGGRFQQHAVTRCWSWWQNQVFLSFVGLIGIFYLIFYMRNHPAVTTQATLNSLPEHYAYVLNHFKPPYYAYDTLAINSCDHELDELEAKSILITNSTHTMLSKEWQPYVTSWLSTHKLKLYLQFEMRDYIPAILGHLFYSGDTIHDRDNLSYLLRYFLSIQFDSFSLVCHMPPKWLRNLNITDNVKNLFIQWNRRDNLCSCIG